MKSKVHLVGAGPGDPGLLTVKALKLLQSADVVLHDELVSPAVLGVIPKATILYNVGKRCGKKNISQERINVLLVSMAASGLRVVRLKAGDPLVFGRGGEELQALRRAGIEVEVVPGITAALGASAAAQIPLTQRQISSAVLLWTGHHCEENIEDNIKDNLEPWVTSNATIVLYMPGYNYETTSRKLLQAGLKAETPCAIISCATTLDQQVYRTTIDELASSPHLPAPTLLIIGDVVKTAREASPLAGDVRAHAGKSFLLTAALNTKAEPQEQQP